MVYYQWLIYHFLELNYKEFANELFKESYEEKKLLASFNIINAFNTEDEIKGLFEVLCLILLEFFLNV